MRRSPLAAAVLATAVLMLAGCATPSAVSTTPEPQPPSSATPTAVAPVVVGPMDMPPVAFGGDCAKALTPDDIAEATGLQGQWVAIEATSASAATSANVGALWCGWSQPDGGGAIYLEVIPQAGLDGATFPAASTTFYFEDCDTAWPCAWQGGNDSVWIALSFQALPDLNRENADVWGAALGDTVAAHHSAAGDEPWTRDRAGWWPTPDCAQVAGSVASQLGLELSGEEVGYIDPPMPGHVMADAASRSALCSLATPEGVGVAALSLTSGTGASAPTTPALDLGVPGITAATSDGGYYLGGDGFTLTDGTNVVWIEARQTGERSPQQIATAIAAAAASDFQL